MKVFNIVFVFIFLGLTACAKNGGDVPRDQLPIEHLPDQAQVLGYNLELYLQERKDEFTGHLEIDLVLNEPTSRLWIHGAQLRMGVIQIIGATISNGEWYQHTPEGLASIVFDKEIPAGHSKLILDYSAPYSSGLKGLIRSKDKKSYLANMAEAGARYVLPGFDEPKFRAPLTVSINLPKQLSALTSSNLMIETPLENERHVLSFATTERLVLGDFGLAVGEFTEKNQTNNLRFINTDLRADLIATMSAIEADSQQPYPYKTLNIIAMPEFNESINAAGLMVNVGQHPAAYAQHMASQFTVMPAGFRNWRTRCVATGIARWLGLQAIHSKQVISAQVLSEQWVQARNIGKYALGEICWDMPSDLVFSTENNEDHLLITGLLSQISMQDVGLAQQLWVDALQQREDERLVQDFPANVYQGIYPLLQTGQLTPNKCTEPCLYPWSDNAKPITAAEALANPSDVDHSTWRGLLHNDDVRAYLLDVFERSKGFPPASAQRVYGDAWQVAFGLAMQKDFDQWSSYLRRIAAEAKEPAVRMNALFALTESTDERVIAWLQQLFFNQVLNEKDADVLFNRLMSSPQASVQFNWFTTNRDKLMRKMTPAQRAHWLDALGNLCGEQLKASVVDAMQPVAKFIYRGEARLQRALAKISSCSVD